MQPSPDEIKEILNSDSITSSEALRLVKRNRTSHHFDVTKDKWSLVQPAPKFVNEAELQILIAHEEEMEIAFPTTPLTFYRWACQVGIPVNLRAEVVKFFEEKWTNIHWFDIPESTVRSAFEAEKPVGWHADIADVVVQLLDDHVIPTASGVITSLRNRKNKRIVRFEPNRVFWDPKESGEKELKYSQFERRIKEGLKQLELRASNWPSIPPLKSRKK